MDNIKYTAFMCRYGLVLDYKTQYKFIEQYQPDLTLLFKPVIGKNIIKPLYSVIDTNGSTRFRIPRSWHNKPFISVIRPQIRINQLSAIYLNRDKLVTSNTPILSSNQELVVNTLVHKVFTYTNITLGTASTILHMPAGTGKTYVAAGLIKKMRVNRVLYITPSRELNKQCAADLNNAFGEYSGAQFATFNGSDIKAGKSTSVVDVLTIHMSIKQSIDFVQSYQLIILDECHTYCADTYRAIYSLIGDMPTLGMTATPYARNDPFDKINTAELCAHPMIKATKLPDYINDETHFNINVSVIKYIGDAEHTQVLKHDSTGHMFMHYMHQQVAEDSARLQIATCKILELYDDGHDTFIFAEEKNILEILSCKLLEMRPQIECEIGIFTGDTKPPELARIRQSARIIFTTYFYSGTGVSIPRMTAIVMFTSRKSKMGQIIPRILRKGGNPDKTREVIDFVDAATPVSRQYQERFKTFKSLHATIRYYTLNHEDMIIRETTAAG